jgi:hypothetical protein
MRRSELLFNLFQVTLKFWKFIFWKTQKCYMMSSCMIEHEFPPEPYMLFRLEKLLICCLILHWVLSSFVDPYERFVTLLKSRSRTHRIYLLLLHWEYAKHALHLDPSKNILLLHWEWTPKTYLIGFSSTK